MTSSSVLTRRGAGRRTVLAQRPLLQWRTIDLITATLIAVTMGVAFWGWGHLYEWISAPLTGALLPVKPLLYGPWLLAGVVAGLVVRRPGAALLTEMLAATVSALLITQWGWLVLLSGALQGLGAELILAIVLYRRFGAAVAMAAGAVSGLFGAAFELVYYYPDLAVFWKAVYAVNFMISGAVIAGLGGLFLVRALARTGAVDATPPGQEAHQRQAV